MKKYFYFILLLVSITSYYTIKEINIIKDNKNTKEAIDVVKGYFDYYNDDKLELAYKYTTEKQDPFNELWGPPSYTCHEGGTLCLSNKKICSLT